MSLFYDIAKYFLGSNKGPSAKEIAKTAINDPNKLLNCAMRLRRNDAITLKAKEAVNMYPVLFSEDVMLIDDNLVLGINGYLEQQYAIFHMLATGLTPVLGKNDEIREYLSNFYTHESEVVEKDFITKMLEEDEVEPTEPEDYIFTEDGIPDVTDKVNPKIGLSSTEMEERGYFDEVSSESDKNNVERRAYLMAELEEEKKKDKPDLDRIEELAGEVNETFNEGKKYSRHTSAQIEKITEKAKTTDPTIVRVKFQVPNTSEMVDIPIAVKASIHPLDPEECAQIFTYLKEDKKLTTFIRLLSGELKLFKDIVFQLDRAKKDKDLYNKLGRHPWFRQLLNRRLNKRVRNIAALHDETKKMVAGKTDMFPVCSLIVTKSEVEKGYMNTFSTFLRQRDDIMNKMMLLCIGVVDPVAQNVTFCFYGMENPSIIKFNILETEFKVKKGDNEKDMMSLMKTLVHKI